ncbi:MAG: hypothetical protein M3P27_13470, partial [Acidobacteriota bacterium]|nr:hypothetical protein [Acidobacteriota bacterium]
MATKKTTAKSAAQEAVESKHVLVLRTCSADLTSNSYRLVKGKKVSGTPFVWPEKGKVECTDWDPSPVCGGGLHGLAWGDGNARLLDNSNDAKWQVVKVLESDLIAVDGDKVKFPRGEVIYTGNMADAMAMVIADSWHIDNTVSSIQEEAAKKKASSKAASSGDSSKAASSGDSSKAASSGDSSTAASSGDSSTAASSGDYSKAASSGDSSTAASSGDSSTAASSGDSST